jgi:cytochrome P450
VTSTDVPACPMSPARDDRKSAALAAQRVHPDPGARAVTGFEAGRSVLRSAQMRQAGAGSEQMKAAYTGGYVPVFFLDGEPHRRQRTAIARFFTPRPSAPGTAW